VPTYDYQCRSCGSVTEIIHSMLEDGPTSCEQCGGVLRRVIYPSGIIFKGSGFYRTDSRGDSSTGGGKSSGSSGASKESKDGGSATSTGAGTGTGTDSASSGPSESSGSTTPATSGSS
jgi:putative FmdB family regulatory protein